MTKKQSNNVSDVEAMKTWSKIPKDIQGMLLENVFCSTCGVTTIIDYTINNFDYGIVLNGTCASCGGKVARVVD